MLGVLILQMIGSAQMMGAGIPEECRWGSPVVYQQ